MSQPTRSQVHVDTPLTNMSVAFLQNDANFVAGRVFPNIPVSKQSDLYYTWDRGFFNRNEAKQRAPGTEAAVGGLGLSTASYGAKVWGLKRAIPDQVAANADAAVNLERAVSESLMINMLISKEVDWASRYFTTGVWTTDITGVASGPSGPQVIHWSDQSAGMPIENIRTAKTTMLESTGMMPNTLVMGQRVLDALLDHPDIVDRIKYSGGVGPASPAITTEAALAQLFGLERILVSRGIQNSALEGLTNVHSLIAGKNALLCYSAPTPGLMTASAGYTFSWSGYLGTTNAFGVAVARRYDDNIRSTWLEVEAAYDHKLVAADLGYYFASIVA